MKILTLLGLGNKKKDAKNIMEKPARKGAIPDAVQDSCCGSSCCGSCGCRGHAEKKGRD